MLAQAASATDGTQCETVRASASRWSVPAAGGNHRRASCPKRPQWKKVHHASVLRRTGRTHRRPWLSVMHLTPPAKSSQPPFAMLRLCCVYPCCGLARPPHASTRIGTDLTCPHRSRHWRPAPFTLTLPAATVLPRPARCTGSHPSDEPWASRGVGAARKSEHAKI